MLSHYHDGMRAHSAGKKSKDNPHEKGTDAWLSWQGGWIYAASIRMGRQIDAEIRKRRAGL